MKSYNCCLTVQGKAYKVTHAEISEDEPATTKYILQPASTDDVLSDKAAHLEVIRQVKAVMATLDASSCF